ncbi:MAG: putative quinol monooxygenase [Nitrolancea sp.]
MITALVFMTAKSGSEGDWQALVEQIHASTHAEDEGCISFDVYRQLDAPREYVLHEQWRDADALTGHFERLRRVYGPPANGSQLPAALLDLLEEISARSYQVIG